MKPQNQVLIKWSPNFAYAIGLIVTDGCVSKDGRHIDLTSKDREQLVNFMEALGINLSIGIKRSGIGREYMRVQIGDVSFHKFLVRMGIAPNKTKTIGKLPIPKKYFFDFLRGHLDGDGTFYAYWDPRWKASYMFYLVFLSASREHIQWLQDTIYAMLNVRGYISKTSNKTVYHLKFAKKESLTILKRIYPQKRPFICLNRKHLKVIQSLSIIGLSL